MLCACTRASGLIAEGTKGHRQQRPGLAGRPAEARHVDPSRARRPEPTLRCLPCCNVASRRLGADSSSDAEPDFTRLSRPIHRAFPKCSAYFLVSNLCPTGGGGGRRTPSDQHFCPPEGRRSCRGGGGTRTRVLSSLDGASPSAAGDGSRALLLHRQKVGGPSQRWLSLRARRPGPSGEPRKMTPPTGPRGWGRGNVAAS